MRRLNVNEHRVLRWVCKASFADAKGGSTKKLDNEDLRIVIKTNPRQTVRELVEELGASAPRVSGYLKGIGGSQKLEKWVS